MSTQRFAGKVMVVTGAAQGIGRAVALRAAAEGGKVLFVDRADFVCRSRRRSEVARTRPASSPTSRRMKARHRRWLLPCSKFGGIDILINGVGGAIRMRPFAEFEPAQIDAEIRRSLMPTLYACHAVLPHLLKRGGGTIVNVSSNATRGIRRVPYSAAKGGVNAMTQSLAMEYAEHNIRVVATAPGGTDAPPRRVPRNTAGDSEQEKVWMGEAVKQVTESTFLKRYGSIDEQVAPILFLASDEAGYITGTVLPVAGGDTG